MSAYNIIVRDNVLQSRGHFDKFPHPNTGWILTHWGFFYLSIEAVPCVRNGVFKILIAICRLFTITSAFCSYYFLYLLVHLIVIMETSTNHHQKFKFLFPHFIRIKKRMFDFVLTMSIYLEDRCSDTHLLCQICGRLRKMNHLSQGVPVKFGKCRNT